MRRREEERNSRKGGNEQGMNEREEGDVRERRRR